MITKKIKEQSSLNTIIKTINEMLDEADLADIGFYISRDCAVNEHLETFVTICLAGIDEDLEEFNKGE